MPDKAFEQSAYLKGYRAIAGLDEAGRGPLAGPVVACACILPFSVDFPYLNDSKKLSAQKRCKIFKILKEDPSVYFGIGISDAKEIDEINILRATERAMQRAVQNLEIKADYLLIDGKYLKHPSISFLTIVKGDQKSQSIAAASIIAKETRDQIMQEMHTYYPLYRFDQHKGYPTVKHYEAIKNSGVSPEHRLSFSLEKKIKTT